MAFTVYNFPNQVRGDSWTFEITIQDQNNQAVDISSNEYWLTLKSNIDQTDNEAALQIGPIAGGAGGVVIISATPLETEITPQTYSYDLQEVTSTGKVNTLLLGKVKVVKDVTRTADYTGSDEVITTSKSGTAVYSGETETTSQTEIFFRTTTDSTLGITENASLAFDALISGKDTITNESCAFQINGVAERDGNTSRIIGSTGKFVLGTENAVFDAAIEVDDTDDTLRVLVTPASTNRTVWSAKVDYTEVYYVV
jgi:hypothetical protein